jgi:phage baseplate assembly protein gpV
VQSADKWHVTWKDGSTFDYDRSTHTLAVNVVSNGTINITVNGGSANVDTYNSHTHGDPSEGNTTIPGQLMP